MAHWGPLPYISSNSPPQPSLKKGLKSVTYQVSGLPENLSAVTGLFVSKSSMFGLKGENEVTLEK